MRFSVSTCDQTLLAAREQLGNPARPGRSTSLAVVLTALVSLSSAANAESGALKVELNKLEAQDKGCRAYVVVTNGGQTTYKTMKLDLVMFRTDGVIGRRFAIDLAPIAADKRSVKLFTLDGTPCEEVGSLLINDVMECATDAGPADNCLAQMSLSSLSKVQLSK